MCPNAAIPHSTVRLRKRSENAGALGWSAGVNHGGELGPGEPPVDLGGSLKPRCDVGSRRLEREQSREHPSGRFNEKPVVAAFVRKQRLREGKRLRLVLHFISRRPVRHSAIERIQNLVTAVGLVELRRELKRRVVDDRCLASIGDLLEELSDQRRLAGPCVAHQEEVAALVLTRDSEDLASGPSKQQRRNRNGVACGEADSVTVRQPIELRRAQQFRAAQSLPATHFLGLAAVARVADGDRNGNSR